MNTPKQSLERRFAAALQRRLRPNGSLRVKTLSHDTGYSEDTIARWVRGKHRVFAAAVEDLATYFATRHADHGFLHEVFEIAGSSAANVESADRCLWITEDAVLPSPNGHAAWLRDTLGLSSGIDDDRVRFGVIVQGWVAAVVQAQGRLVLRYSPRGVRPSTALRLREWLACEARHVALVQFVMPVKSGWSSPAPVSVIEALRILEWNVRTQDAGEAFPETAGASAQDVARL